ncbi:hypothetical protein [Neobacillus cucumis]|nr:hypothetical protein [Neobacillus cucumis]
MTISLILIVSIFLFKVSNVWIFVLFFIITRTVTQFLVNVMDQYFVSVTPNHMVSFHSKITSLFQLLGIMIAPVYFAFILPSFAINSTVLALLSAYTLLIILVNTQSPTNVAQERFGTLLKGEKLTFQDILFLIYVISLASASLLFSSNTVFLLADYYQMKSSVLKSGVLLTTMNVFAIVAVMRTKSKLKSTNGELLAPSKMIHLKISIGLFIAMISLFLTTAITFWILLFLGALIGYIYGLFYLFARQYASYYSVKENKPLLISLYNNNSSYAVIISSIALFATAITTHILGVDITKYIIGCIGLFLIISIVASTCFIISPLRKVIS